MTFTFKKLWSNLHRKKTLTTDSLRTDLKKCLTLFDMIFLAIGSMIGSGMYVLTGTIAHNIAGPSVVVSYIIAAIASGLSAICYAEFGARVPVTGSAYQFTYLSLGEFWAFIIGWNVLIEHVVTSAAVAKAWSGYLDSILGNPVQKYLLEHAPMVGGGIVARYPDLIAVGLLIVMTSILAAGAKLSTKVTAGFAGLNLIIVAIIIGTGLHLGNVKNWTSVEGGFFPFGFSGTISGAATLIFSYVGYEVIASTTEESLNPDRDVPLSLFIGLTVVVIAYVGTSAALTLMVPYYDISVLSPFPDAYNHYGWAWTRYLVTVGALAAMTTAILATMYVVPRYLFAMARDGLLMNPFTYVSGKTKVPLVSVVVTGVTCILFAIVFEYEVLVEFIAIGQLLACTFVAVCVIKLRYQPNSITRFLDIEQSEHEFDQKSETNRTNRSLSEAIETSTITEASSANNSTRKFSNGSIKSSTGEDTCLINERAVGAIKTWVLQSRFGHVLQPFTRFKNGELPNYLIIIATFFGTFVIVLCLFTQELISSWWSISLIIIFSLISLSSISLLLLFNKDNSIKTYKVPWVPFLPFTSALINIILMLKLPATTWIRLVIWVFIGLIIYIFYGYSHSVERKDEDQAEIELE